MPYERQRPLALVLLALVVVVALADGEQPLELKKIEVSEESRDLILAAPTAQPAHS